MNSKFILILIFNLSSLFVFSQVPVKEWDADFGGSDIEQLSAGQQTKEGGYIFGGYTESDTSGDVTQPTRGSSDYWIVKTDSNGIKQWDARFGGTSVDRLTALQQTSDGGYILGGISFSGIGGDKTQSAKGINDYWIVKINRKGIKQWDAAFGGSSFDELYALQQTSDGGYILGGASLSDSSGDKTQKTRGGKDFWIVKLDSAGNKQWDAAFGGSLFEELFSLQQTTDGGYILGGYSLSGVSGDKTDPNHGRYDYWVVKTDSKGKKQWDATYGGKDDDWLEQLRQTNDGEYILGGWSWSGRSGDKSQASKGDNDYWIVKIDKRGVRQWDASYGGSTNDYLRTIQQTADGGYVLGGYSSSLISGDKTQDTKGGTDYWMVKTDSKGVKQWDVDFGGSEFEFLYALRQTKDGGFILGGYSSSGISGDKTQENKGLNDYWVVKTTSDGVSCNIPTNLQTTNITSDGATLRWRKVEGAINYYVQYRIYFSDWTTVSATNNRTVLTGLFEGSEYDWRVRAVCSNGQRLTSSGWSVKQSFETVFSQQAMANTLRENNLVNVYPNPVLQSATLAFSLNKASPAKITVMDMNGSSLTTIADGNFLAGNHKIKFNRGSLPAGLYLLQIKTADKVLIKKITLE